VLATTNIYEKDVLNRFTSDIVNVVTVLVFTINCLQLFSTQSNFSPVT